MMTVSTMHGLGDSLYLRPVLKWFPEQRIINLLTPWPQVFHDFKNVRICLPQLTNLRTQTANMLKHIELFNPSMPPNIRLTYDLQKNNIMHSYFDCLYPAQPSWVDMSFPVKDEWIQLAKGLIKNDKPICLIRPNTLRREWMSHARNCKNEYLQLFINKYAHKYHFVTLASIDGHREWYEHDLTGIHQKIENIDIETTFGLFKIADVIVTAPCFWLPLGMSLNSKMLVLYGAHFSHWDINDKRIKAPNLVFVEPTPFERCAVHKPNAFKDIDRDILMAAFEEVTSK
jgi:hypothetical protein